MSGAFFQENAWGTERTTHRMGVGEGGGSPLELPPDATIVLARIQDSEYFHVMIDGEPLTKILHKSADFFREISEHLHTVRIRKELDNGII